MLCGANDCAGSAWMPFVKSTARSNTIRTANSSTIRTPRIFADRSAER